MAYTTVKKSCHHLGRHSIFDDGTSSQEKIEWRMGYDVVKKWKHIMDCPAD